MKKLNNQQIILISILSVLFLMCFLNLIINISNCNSINSLVIVADENGIYIKNTDDEANNNSDESTTIDVSKTFEITVLGVESCAISSFKDISFNQITTYPDGGVVFSLLSDPVDISCNIILPSTGIYSIDVSLNDRNTETLTGCYNFLESVLTTESPDVNEEELHSNIYDLLHEQIDYFTYGDCSIFSIIGDDYFYILIMKK